MYVVVECRRRSLSLFLPGDVSLLGRVPVGLLTDLLPGRWCPNCKYESPPGSFEERTNNSFKGTTLKLLNTVNGKLY